MKHVQRILATVLTLALFFTMIPAEVMATVDSDPADKPTEILTTTGETVEIDENWEEQYPYGAFAFDLGEASLAEGGDDLYVDVYRMGGTSGRATVYILFNPMCMPSDEEGTMGSSSAAGFDDLAVEAEDMLPLAAYQPVGKDPDPEPGDAGYLVMDYTGEDAQEGDQILCLDAAADSYQWYSYMYNNWQKLEGADDDYIILAGADLETYDFRCVYSVGGVRYCSDSYHGEVYVKPEPEALDPMPDDIELVPDQTFTRILPEDGAATDPYVFALTFADGEWVKQLHLTPLEDTISEPMKFATFTMIANDGGDIFHNGGTLILSIEDNDEPEPFTLSFEQTATEADKAAGKARLTVVRTGGNQLPVSVSYRTADGSAKAGQDYEAVSGELAFFADVDRQTIEIPLIDDGAVTDELKTFTVTLGEITGDLGTYGTLQNTLATVSLYNSGTAEQRNLATMLAVTNRNSNAPGSAEEAESAPDAGADVPARDLAAMLRAPSRSGGDYDVAEDASGLAVIGGGLLKAGSDGPITGTQQTVADEDRLYGQFDLGRYEVSNSGGLQTYRYGSISFNGQHGGNYWGDFAYIAGTSHKDYTNWDGGSWDGDSRLVKSCGHQEAKLTIPNMCQYFDRFEGWGEFKPEWASDWTCFWYGDEYTYPVFSISTSNHTYGYLKSITEHTSGHIKYWTSHDLDSSDFDINDRADGVVNLTLWRYDSHDSKNAAWGKITDGSFRRRVFGKDLNLTIHTANDGESGNGNVVTAPDGGARLTAGSGVYESMKPVVSIEPGSGGVKTSSGKLYVGSKIKVSLTNTASYFPYSGEELSTAVYLTRADGSVVNAPVEKRGNDYYITLFWSNINGDDLNDEFTINVVMTRKQEITLDLTQSVARRVGKDGKPTLEIDSSKVPDALDLFWNSAAGSDNRIKVICSTALKDQPHFKGDELTTIYIDRNGLDGKETDPVKALGTLENVQCINFNRSEKDKIAYHGKAYDGNADIWLDTADLAGATANFLYYNEAFLSVAGTMNATVDSVAIYYDGDGDGRINGKYDTATGYFEIDKNSSDSLFMFIDKGESMNEISFQPVEDEHGKFHEFFAKVFYTMSPRCFTAPPSHENDVAQVLPAITTSVTDAAHYAELTEAQQSYRYLVSGVDSDGQNTSDNHLMYGPEATAMQFVDVPLGGDHAPAYIDNGNDNDPDNDKIVWTPDYNGHLLVPFDNPEPIILEHSMVGDNFPLVDFDFDEESRTFTFTDAAKQELNDYLGSFVGDSTIALCVQEQQYATGELKNHVRDSGALAPESNTLIERTVYMDAGNIAQVESGVGNSDTLDSGFPSMPNDENPMPGLVLDGTIKNSGFKFTFPGAMPYLTVIFDSDAVLFVFSCPILNWANDGKGRQWGPKPSWDKMVGKDKKVDELQQAMDENDMQEMSQLINGEWDDDSDGGDLSAGAGAGPAQQGKMKSHGFSMSLTVTAIIALKRNKVTNSYEFSEFTFGVVASFSYRYEQRFVPCPAAYFFVKVSFSLSISLSVKRYTVQTNRVHPVAQPDKPIVLKKGEVFELESPYNIMDIQFDGQLYIQPLEDSGGTALKQSNKGMLKSAGAKKTVKFTSATGTAIPDKKTAYIRIWAQEDTTITKLDLVTEYKQLTRFGGVKLVITPGLEIGVGVGCDVAKIELFLRIAVEMAFRFGAYDPVTDKQGAAEVDHIKIQLGIYLNITFLAFSFEFEIAGGTFTYTPNGGWKCTFDSTFAPPDDALTAPGDDVGLPVSSAGKQSVRSPNMLLAAAKNGNRNDAEEAAALEAGLKAYNTDAPFQVSGFSGSSSAFTLVDGLARGYTYEVVTAGGENYVLYTVSRSDAESAIDHSMLVMSRLIVTGAVPGLVNPIDETDETPYIVVDGETDSTGDLECEAWADGGVIRVAWVSYADRSDADTLRLTALSASALFREATGSRVVKTASFDTTDPNATGFSATLTVSDGDGDLVFLPAVENDTVAFVEADPMAADERADAIKRYTAALKAAGYDPDPSNTDDARQKIGAYRLQTQTALWDASGGVNRITVSQMDDTGVARSIRSELTFGQTVENLEFAKIGTDYYLVFTTSEIGFLDANGEEPDDPDEIVNMVTIKRLCLKQIHADGAEFSTEKTRVLRTVYDFENENAGYADGLYVGGEKQSASDPTIANLRFLNANLGKALGNPNKDAAETFLLFEMNGCTYIVREDDLCSLALGQQGTILPFFEKDTDATTGEPEDGVDSIPGRTGATIGADGDGGLAAVYISTVPDTANNALYFCKYDPATGWGAGTMLAMNHMDVYEASIREKWNPEQTAAAYLDQDLGGGKDLFRFSDLKIALGTKGTPESSASGNTEAEAESGEHGQSTTLLVLTQGTFDHLVKQTGDKTGNEQYAPDPKDAATHTGVYAISYGAGQQAVGKGSLTFLNHDFAAGAELVVTANFTNTGDVSIRGSKDQPITVSLVAEGNFLHSTTLASWTITKNILPGQDVSLNGTFTLPVTLPWNTSLNLSVAEFDGYSDKPFAAVLQGLKTVQRMPELGFEGEVSLTPANTSASGVAVYDVDFTVGNRGTADGEDVFVKFSYDTGEIGADGKSIYKAMDISTNDLVVGKETPLKSRQQVSDFTNGILALDNIRTGKGRTVTGTLTVPTRCFTAADGNRAELRLEIFSYADEQNGTYIDGVHGEYNEVNNAEYVDVTHSTFFDLPQKLTIPMGTTLRMPVHYNVTDPGTTHVLVAEFPHTEADSALRSNSSSRFKLMDQRISELYYDESSFTNGVGTGTVVITPMEEGSSYVRIMDLGTNSYVDVACEVTPGGEGLNVFPDTGIFTFKNADGTVYDPAATPSTQGWVFSTNVDSWGADGSAPYRNDLAKAKTGATMQYESESESIKLVFNGKVQVDSTFPGFEPVTLTAVGGGGRNAGEAAVVTFGNNPAGMAHTITITVLESAESGQYAEFDRLVEYYHGDSPFTIANDHGPAFYWSSSFPQPGTVRSGTTVSQTLSIVDDAQISDVWLEDTDVAAAGELKKDGDLWVLPLTISGNGTIIIHARDSAGNHAISQVDVDWFGTALSSNIDFSVGTSNWGSTGLKLLKGDDGTASRHLVVSLGENVPENVEVTVSYLGSDISGALMEHPISESKALSNCFRAEQDGLYVVRAEVTVSEGTDPAYACRIRHNDGTVEEFNAATVTRWSSKVLRVEEDPQPEPEPYYGGDETATETVKEVVGEDGTTARVTTDAAGTITDVKVTVSEKALESAGSTTVPVTIPVGSGSPDTLPVIHVEMADVSEDTPVGQLPQIAVPVTGADSATVAFQRRPNGSWTPVKDCCIKDGKLIVPVEGSCDIVIGSNRKYFSDVAADAWYADYVAFVTARGIFNGTDRGFEPEGTMTRAMIAQVLYNLDRRSTAGIRAGFSDVAADVWYADAVGWAAGEGIIKGYDGIFAPDAPVTRQDLVTILYRYAAAAGYPIAGGADLSGFTDAAGVADYAREAMAWAVAIGAVSGMGDGTLNPGGSATRAQVAKIMQVFIEAMR